MSKKCLYCYKEIPNEKRADSIYCGSKCRQHQAQLTYLVKNKIKAKSGNKRKH